MAPNHCDGAAAAAAAECRGAVAMATALLPHSTNQQATLRSV